jgi:hypothetical protein
MKPSLNHLQSGICAVGMALALLAGATNAQEKSKPAKGEFSFDVYGDSRSMMYLPYKQDQEAEARQFMLA